MMRAPGLELHMARCDESSAFSSVSLPEWVWPWMATPAVPAFLVWNLLSPAMRAGLREWDA
eukprot:8408608-Pyramimonas_sp.AAC.1